MATRCFIACILPGGRYERIYCHWDGYPEWAGAMLSKWYTNDAAIDRLMRLGDLSTLGETPFAWRSDARRLWVPDMLSDEYQTLRYRFCVAYGTPATVVGSLDELLSTLGEADTEYLYVWNGEEWEYASREYAVPELRPLEP